MVGFWAGSGVLKSSYAVAPFTDHHEKLTVVPSPDTPANMGTDAEFGAACA
jgi:hypothetical protein